MSDDVAPERAAGYPVVSATPAVPETPPNGADPVWSPTAEPSYPWAPPAPIDQHGLGGSAGPASQYARRIEPTPRPPRRTFLLYAVAGLVVGLIVFGTGGFFAGRATGGGGGRPAAVAPSAAPQPAFVTAAAAKFDGELGMLAKPWLGDISGCLRDTDPGGPKLGSGEKVHVLCRDGGMYLHFVTYVSADEKAGDRGYRQQLALASAAILAGAEQPGRRLGGVTGSPGTYIEYATRGPNTPALCGVWWDLDNTTSAVYLELLCDSLGGKWDPLRAVWQSHS